MMMKWVLTTGPGQCNVCHFYAPAKGKVIQAFAADMKNLVEAKIHQSSRTLLLVCVDADSSTKFNLQNTSALSISSGRADLDI